MNMKKLIMSLALSLLFLMPAKSQDYDLGLYGGLTQYAGDLYPFLDNGIGAAMRGMRPAGGALARLNLHPNFSLRGNLVIGYMAAYDRINMKGLRGLDARNLSFHSPIIELSGVGEFHFKKYIHGVQRYKWSPFLYAGLGVTYFEPKTWLDGERYNLRKLETEIGKSYSPLTLSIPIGLGVKFAYKDYTITLESGYRWTPTDYLDDVSAKAPNSAVNHDNNPNASIAQKLAIRRRPPRNVGRGNPDANDGYFVHGITIAKTFRTYKCK